MADTTRRGGGGGTRDWRGSARDVQARQGAKKVVRTLLTAVVCVLLVGLGVMLLLPFFAAKTYLAALPVTSYRLLSVPPVPFVQEDVAMLSTLQDLVHHGATEPTPLDWRDLQTSQGVQQQLETRLSSLVQREKDVLLLTLSAQGVSDNGTAYLLFGDFDPAQDNVGRVRAAEVLKSVARSRARLKVVLFDAGPVVADARLGMVVNEFPRLLERELQQIQDPGLWVVLGHDLFETAHYSRKLQRSVFGCAVTAALNGAADTNLDGDLELKEFTDFVQQHVSSWVDRQTGGQYRQTPVVLRGGTGRVTPDQVPAGEKLLTARPRESWEKTVAQALGLSEPAIPAGGTPEGHPAGPKEGKGAVPAGTQQSVRTSTGRGAGSPVSRTVVAGGPLVEGWRVSQEMLLAQSDRAPGDVPAAGKPAGTESPARQPSPPKTESNQPADVKPAPSANQPTDANQAPAINPAPSANQPTDANRAADSNRAGATGKTGTGTADRNAGPGAGQGDGSRDDIGRLLLAGWQLRDEFQQRGQDGAWLPIDYAPHLWRHFQEQLLSYDLRSRAGAAIQESRLVQDLQADVLTLRERLALAQAGGMVGTETIVDRLAGAQQRFQRSDVRTAYQELHAEIRAAVQLRNEILQRLPYFVRWHAHTHLIGGGHPALTDSLRQLLPVVQSFSELTERATTLSPGTADWQAALRTLRVSQREVRDLWSTLNGLIETEVAALTANPADAGYLQRLEQLLSTPLPSAAQRQRLLAALPLADSFVPNFSLSPVPPSSRSALMDEHRHARVLQQLEFEVGLLRLTADESQDKRWLAEVSAALDDFRQVNPGRSGSDAGRSGGGEQGGRPDDKTWQVLSRAGAGIQKAYREFPGRIYTTDMAARAQGVAEHLADLRRAERCLRLVDARDALQLGPVSLPAPLPAPAPPEVVTVAFVESVVPVSVVTDDLTPIELTARASGPVAGEGVLSFDFNPSLLEVRLWDGKQAIEPKKPAAKLAFTVGESVEAKVRCRVVAKVVGEQTTPLELVLEVGGQKFKRTVPIALPAAEHVDLVGFGPKTALPRLDGPADQGAKDAGGVLTLAPFPNLLTPYRLGLINRAKRDRKVRVETFLVPASYVVKPGTERVLNLDATGKPPIDFVPLAALQELAIPGDGSLVPLGLPSFQTPAAPPAAGKGGANAGTNTGANAGANAGAGDATSAENKGATAKKRLVVSQGVVCVISDLGVKDRRWIKWIDFQPQHPRNYLDVEAGYDRLKGRVTLVARPRDFDNDGRPDIDRLPPRGSKIQWELNADLNPQAAMKLQGDIGAPAYEAQLFADVPPDAQKTVTIQLTVDGYPRAFVCRVNCGQSTNNVRPLRDVRQIRITAPAPGDVFLAPLATLPVTLQIDAPADAFRDPTQGDVVEIGVDERLDRTVPRDRVLRFTSDRHTTLWLDDLGPDGKFPIETQVRDFQIDLDPQGLVNTTVEIVAQMTLARQDPEKDYVQVVLDGAPPMLDVESPQPGASFVIGNDLAIVCRVKDLSGVQKIEAAFDPQNTGKLDKPELATFDSGRGAWTVRLPTKEVKPGTYVVLVRATDKVGLVSDLKRLTLNAVAPKAAPSPADLPKNNIVRGRVTLGGQPVGRMTVNLLNSGAPPQRTGDDGTFEFRDVPPGRYQLTVKGVARNRERESRPRDVMVDAPPKPAVNVGDVEVQ